MRVRPPVLGLISTATLATAWLVMYVLFPGTYSQAAEGARRIGSEVFGSKVHVLSFTTSDSDLISRVQVFSGSFQGFYGDPRIDNHIRLFPYALLVADKGMGPTGRITFLLRPGSYFVYATVDSERASALTGPNVDLSVDPQDVVVQGDMEVSPVVFISH